MSDGPVSSPLSGLGPDLVAVEGFAHDDLIGRLSQDLRPVARLAVARRLLIGVSAGAAVSALLTTLTLGLRPDMAQAVAERIFWVKFAYTLALAGLAVWGCERLARPAGTAGRRLPWILAPVLAVVAMAAWQLVQAPASDRMPMVMGGSFKACPWCIVAFSLPPLAGMVWALRGMAPTRLRLTGAVTGLAAGGAGAAAYALHCTESTMPFLAVWYSLGVVLSGAVGWLVAPRLLRW